MDMEPNDENLPPEALSKSERIELAIGSLPYEKQRSAAELIEVIKYI